MKARTKEDNAGFKPVTIEITFETKQEMEDFRSALSYFPVSDVLDRLDLDVRTIKDAIPCECFSGVDWQDFIRRSEGEKEG